MKKRLIVSHLAALLVGALMFGSVALAASKIDVEFLPLKYFINGEQKFPPVGEQGFIYNGRTYVPLRFLAESLGYDVKWNGADSSIHITVSGTGQNNSQVIPPDIPPVRNTDQYMSDILKPYDSAFRYKINDTMTMGTKEYHKGYSFEFFDNLGYDQSGSASFNLEGKYNQIKGLVGIEDGTRASIDIRIYGDDKLLNSYKFKAGDLPKPIDLDVKGVVKLEIEFSKSGINPSGFASVNFVDLIIK